MKPGTRVVDVWTNQTNETGFAALTMEHFDQLYCSAEIK